MLRIFRITKSPDVGDLVESIPTAEAFARGHGQGRYEVDEHSLDPFPGTKVSAGASGKVIHHHDGHVA